MSYFKMKMKDFLLLVLGSRYIWHLANNHLNHEVAFYEV